ncbi:helix-turn-helix transcriptional regulator [Rhizobium sp. P32RR-XVIII]|uniref:helix-turn-helix domain-containing protein n=1 Tax=Rhizobium sp. P32RR-XVIII TaxID=2726738 RepID=UPI00145702EA|nr:AraC family transcriptional regulator [Rhizobium sp. P32RR-XVIII]NLS03408.1 helix-turn-helix transcriptional regulator [Rhizobium sp. P32RR-XVIII]
MLDELHSQGYRKYPASRLLRSSGDLGWSTLFAELRSHSSCEGPGAEGEDLEIAVIVSGSDEGAVTCKIGGERRCVRPTDGTIWLNPMAAKADAIHIASEELQVAHLYLPSSAFARLATDFSVPRVPGQAIRYSSGVQDGIISQIALSILREMADPTMSGRMLVETASLFLAARLLHDHSESPVRRLERQPTLGLDNVRLRRVLAYIEEHLTEEITVSDLASIACLSVFHFTRAFAASVGTPPHSYVSGRRLERAKKLLTIGQMSLSEIAFDCQYSSQSSFTRAFRRATGLTPAKFKQAVR